MSNCRAIKTEYLIIGTSAGGIGAAEAIREIDKTNSITMVSDELYPAYSRPLISKYLSGERTVDRMLFRPADFYSNNGIELILGATVQHLNPNNQTAQLENGEQIIWRKLLLATGGVPIVPEMEGGNNKGVFTFVTIKDAMLMDRFIKAGHHAVVIGGGLIGISVAEALVKRGVSVTIVEMKDRILNTILDDTASSIAEETLRQAGVRVITSRTVTTITGETQVDGVILDSGERIPCDLVVVAIGVLPRAELAMDAGIKIGRGILVNRLMSTSCPDIYACGDVAEAYDFVYDSNRVIPTWPNAYIGGRIAGYNMAGIRTEYPGGTAMNSLNYFGVDIATAGIVAPPNDKGWEAVSQRSNGTYKRIILRDNHVMGMVFVNDIEKSGIIYSLMKDRINVTDFKQVLLSDDFGLAYLPRKMWQKCLSDVLTSEDKQRVLE